MWPVTCNSNQLQSYKGVEWFLQKSGPDLEISEVLVMGLEVSFSGDFVSWSLRFWNQGLAVLQSPKFTILYP